MPQFWSVAALPLLELQAHTTDVLERLRTDVESPTLWSPPQLYRFNMILETLRKSSESGVRESATALNEHLAPRLKDLEGTQKLQDDFRQLRLTSTHWLPYEGSSTWLIGRSPETVTGTPLVLAVRWDTVRESIEAAHKDKPPFETATSGPGDVLSEYLPEMRITFPAGVGDAAAGLTPQQSLWGFPSFSLRY